MDGRQNPIAEGRNSRVNDHARVLAARSRSPGSYSNLLDPVLLVLDQGSAKVSLLTN